MLKDYQYDVFLSHRSVNKPWVETLARNLKNSGLKVFFDKWHCELIRQAGEREIEGK